MRIVHVVHAFPPEGYTGVENYTANVARGQAAAGHDVWVYTRGIRTDAHGGEETTEERDGCHVVRVQLGPGPHFSSKRWNPVERERFARFLARVRPDIVHCQHLSYHSLDYPAVAKAAGAATVFTTHDLLFGCPCGSRLDYANRLCDRKAGIGCAPCIWGGRKANLLPHELLARLTRLPGARTLRHPFPLLTLTDTWLADSQRCLNDVDLVLSPSRFVLENLRAQGLCFHRAEVSPIGIERPKQLPPANRNTPGDVMHFGVIGTHHLKGLHIAVEAFRRLPPDLPARLLVYGGKAAELGLLPLPPNAEDRGAFSAAGRDAVFADMDVLIMPSIWYENAPAVIREAFAYGRPVIAANLGGMAESVRAGEDGLLFAPSDPADLARVVGRLVREPGLWERLRQGIRPPVFSDEHTTALLAHYEELLAERTPLTGTPLAESHR